MIFVTEVALRNILFDLAEDRLVLLPDNGIFNLEYAYNIPSTIVQRQTAGQSASDCRLSPSYALLLEKVNMEEG